MERKRGLSCSSAVIGCHRCLGNARNRFKIALFGKFIRACVPVVTDWLTETKWRNIAEISNYLTLLASRTKDVTRRMTHVTILFPFLPIHIMLFPSQHHHCPRPHPIPATTVPSTSLCSHSQCNHETNPNLCSGIFWTNHNSCRLLNRRNSGVCNAITEWLKNYVTMTRSFLIAQNENMAIRSIPSPLSLFSCAFLFVSSFCVFLIVFKGCICGRILCLVCSVLLPTRRNKTWWWW